MGLLNHLFGSRKTIAKELKLDAEKRIKLWEEHLANYRKREELSKRFNFGNVDNALKDLDALDNLLKQIEGLISEEFIHIKYETKADEEIFYDLKALTSKTHLDMIYRLSEFAAKESKRQQAILTIFNRIHNVLKLELHIIRRIRTKTKKRPENLRELLTGLFKLIFNNEGFLYKPFMSERHPDKSVYGGINRVAKAILLEEKIEEAILSAEEKFINEMVNIIGNQDSRHHLRKAAEGIYQELVAEAGAPFSNDELDEGLEELNRLMHDDSMLFRIIKKECPEYDDEKIKAVMKAFRRSFELGHLEGAADLWT